MYDELQSFTQEEERATKKLKSDVREFQVDNLVPVEVVSVVSDLISAKANTSLRTLQRLLQMIDERTVKRAAKQEA